jgi:hypothetical protein
VADSAYAPILTFPILLMRKGLIYAGLLLKRWRVAPDSTAIAATQGVLIAASFEGASLPPVPTPAFLSREGSGRQNARADIQPRRPV